MASKKLRLTGDEIAAPFRGELTGRHPVVLSPQGLADVLNLSVKTVYDWIAKGRLDGSYRKRGKHCLIWRDRALDILFNGKEWT